VDAARRKLLYDDLKGLVRGELLLDELSRLLYASDGSLFEVPPAGAVAPRDEEDLAAVVRYAAENQVPLVPRGGGTGMIGAALGDGLILDLSVHFRAVLDQDATSVTAQAGVPLRHLTRQLARDGRRLAADPDRLDGTVGGLVATNASGPRAHRLGTARDHVSRLRVVLDSGDAATVGRVSRWPSVESAPGRLSDIVSSTLTLLDQDTAALTAWRTKLPLDRVGYDITGIRTGDELHLAKLLVGSEGTLAICTSATLRTIPLPAGRSVVLLGFARLDAALRGARVALASEPTACELLDRRLLRLARGEPGLCDLVPEGAEALLVVEFEAPEQAAAQELADDLADTLGPRERLAIWARPSRDAAEAERFWSLRQAAWPALQSLRGAAQPVAIVEDVAVPPEQLADYLPRVQDVLRRLEMTAAFRVRPATGQVDMRPFVDLQNPRDVERLWTLADEVYPIVLGLGGTISAGNGTGLARMPWVGRQYGPAAPLLRQLKAIFDPRYLLNPGKVVAGPGQPLTWPLRKRGAPRALEAQLKWTASAAMAEAQACGGCGGCRTEAPAERMCPIFRATHAEAATPRAKANLLRHLLQGDADPALLSSDAVRAVADLCVNCKMCARECPVRVQVPRMMLEAKAANVAQHGLDRGDWAMARSEGFARLGSALAPLTNALLGNPVARWLIERIFGVSRKRRLPRFAPRSFLRLARRRGWTRKPRSARPRVAYFVDVFANYNDPTIAQSVVEVLHHNGIEVYVPPGQVGCGMAPLTYGDVETAREAAQHNQRLLAELAREGFPILCSEPTAAVMLRHDARDLLGDDEAEAVAAQVVEFTAFAWDLHQHGLLKTDFRPLRVGVGHHVPCHVKALGRGPLAPALLSLIPGMRVGTIDVGCSGMAGTFGLRADRYETSMAAGAEMLAELRRPDYLFGSTECGACRMQMEDGGGKRTLHPAQYLALAYGLVPGLEARLREPVGRWVLP
jgi:FAD/FMN-containing dehydrogenase/Fe-S oxidoreductase